MRCRIIHTAKAQSTSPPAVEFGAGKGFLSSALVEMAGAPQSLHLLDTEAELDAVVIEDWLFEKPPNGTKRR